MLHPESQAQENLLNKLKVYINSTLQLIPKLAGDLYSMAKISMHIYETFVKTPQLHVWDAKLKLHEELM